MRLPWKRIANVLGYIAPLVGGPVGAIYTAISPTPDDEHDRVDWREGT